MCRCEIEDETPEHYFLRCPFYQGPRIVLLNKLSEILESPVSALDEPSLCHLLLYGKPSLDDITNKNILSASIKFIKSSKRFKVLEAFASHSSP